MGLVMKLAPIIRSVGEWGSIISRHTYFATKDDTQERKN